LEKILKEVNLSKGQLEASISEAMIKFEKDHMGRGPKEVRTHILGDLILVRLKGVLTPAEKQMIKNEEGKRLIKQVRQNLIENSKNLLATIIEETAGRKVISLHTDISTKSGERVIIFVLDKKLEN
jgi:uncharacterized protein YbcI